MNLISIRAVSGINAQWSNFHLQIHDLLLRTRPSILWMSHQTRSLSLINEKCWFMLKKCWSNSIISTIFFYIKKCRWNSLNWSLIIHLAIGTLFVFLYAGKCSLGLLLPPSPLYLKMCTKSRCMDVRCLWCACYSSITAILPEEDKSASVRVS